MGARQALIKNTDAALAFADEYFILATDSPHDFPSYAPTVVLLAAMPHDEDYHHDFARSI